MNKNDLVEPYWNHRVIKKFDYYNEPYYEIHEVYYNGDHTIQAITVNAIRPYGDDIESLRWILERMVKCTERPVLVENEITFVNYEDGDPDPDLDIF